MSPAEPVLEPVAGESVAGESQATAVPAPSPEMQRLLQLYQSGNVREADVQAQALLRQDPDNATVLHLMGLCRLAANDLETAGRAFGRALKQTPEAAPILNSMGVLCRRLNRPEQAMKYFAAAIKHGSELPHPRINLAQILCRQKRFVEAERMLGDILARFPNDPAALIVVATIRTETKAFADTLRLLGRALVVITTPPAECPREWPEITEELPLDEVLARVKRLPRSADELVFLIARIYHESARTNAALDVIEAAMHISASSVTLLALLGNIRSARNELDRARAVYEQVLTRQPTTGAVHLLLADITKYASGSPHLDDMRRLVAAKKLPEKDRCHTSFALAKALDDIGDYEGAAKCLDVGNAIKHKEYTAAAEIHRKRHTNMKEVFTRAFLEDMRDKGDPDPTPIFIVGMPRSGTTLVEQILSSHDEVTPGEEQFLMLEITRRITYLDTGAHFPANLTDMTPETIAAYGRQYVDRLRSYKGDGPFITDKMPHNHESVGFILAALPNAKIIHCYRDPRSTCISIWKHHFEGNHPYAYDREELAVSYRMYQDLMAHWRDVAGERFLEVAYEDVVDDLETQARRMFDYCGLSWTDKALEFHKNERTVRTASLHQVRQPLYRTSLAPWEKYAPFEPALFEQLEKQGVKDWSGVFGAPAEEAAGQASA